MGKWVHTTGLSVIAVAICDRCHFKFPWVALNSDPNYPGLKVCKKCTDVFDPWRLPARIPERINLPFVRPDQSFAVSPPVEVVDIYVTEDGHPLETQGEDVLKLNHMGVPPL